jgi:paraquat-inducible protein B
MAEPRQPEEPTNTAAAEPPTPTDADAETLVALPTSRVVRRERLSVVWLLPVLALLVGGWLAYQSYAERGPSVQVDFPTAAGLQAGKTKVKYKDVDIGTVTAIDVSPDLDHVVVTAELRHGSEQFLAADSRFWVARPRITASQVSGLETLLSGAFVAVDPGGSKQQRRHFQGLADPPVITTDAPGRRYRLRSDALGSLNLGVPVYYRDIQVGQVTSYELDDDGGAVTVDVFVNSPHDALVRTNTRFWNASGIDVQLGADGLQVDTQSVISLLIGGVAFDTPDDLEATGAVAPADQFFPLYPNRRAASEQVYLHKERYLMIFNGSVRGLAVGAPVSLRGIQIGRVLDIALKFNDETLEFFIPVLVEVEPERVGLTRTREVVLAEDPDVVRKMIARGLRAQLKTGNLLTGALYVELDFHADAPPATLSEHDGYRVVPTLPTPLEAVTAKVTQILDKVNGLPIDTIGEDLQATFAGTRALVDSADLKRAIAELANLLGEVRTLAGQLNTDLAPELDGVLATLRETLEQATGTLADANALLGPDAPLGVESVRTMREVSAAARAVRDLADYLERHPEALLKGKGGGR